MEDFVVVGSGPAGVSAAMGLLKRGRKVLMLDGGVRLEPERHVVVARMRSQQPNEWSEADLAVIKEGMESGLEGIPLKRLYGSDFPYQDVEKFVQLEHDGVDMTMSLAMAGLSNVWGAAALPFTAEDMDSWPINLADLEPYYRKIFSFVPLSAVEDHLAEVLPLYAENSVPLQLSRQAEAFLCDLDRAREQLNRKGITFGRSRLAVQACARDGKPDCAYCGLCLYGCPYNLIYNTAHTLEKLRSNPDFDYIPDVIVERIEENSDRVIVHARTRLTNEATTYTAKRVYLGCGVIGTTKILLESLEAYDRPLTMQDSQYFLVPLLRVQSVAGASLARDNFSFGCDSCENRPQRYEQEPLHTLTQLCMELKDNTISGRGIHLSIYTRSEIFESVVRNALGPAARIGPLLEALVSRILVIGGYLHSDDSPTIEVKLLSELSNGKRVMTMRAIANSRTQHVVRGVLRKLVSCALHFKGIPVLPAVRIGKAGRGYHSGGTFPMRRDPGDFECDAAGRPDRLRRVHIVDATCFPTIPATNITLSVMANAYRIAELSLEE